MKTRRMTMAQALIEFLKQQHVERDGREHAFFAGVVGIFGHGNVAGIGQALQENPDFPYILVRNEQAGVQMAAGFAKATNRLRTLACTSSIGPGATNMITGAALATINRLPVLLLPGDIFARRNVAPVLQQLESAATQDIGVNDCFKPVSRYWDRIYRPEQLITSLPEAMQCADVAFRLRRGDAGAAAGRADGSVRLSRRTVSQESVADPERRAGSRVAGARGAGDQARGAAADCVRRRRADERSVAGAERVCDEDWDSGGGDAGGQGRAGMEPCAGSGSDRSYRVAGGEPAGTCGRFGDRNRDALLRLHDGVNDGVSESKRKIREHQHGGI